MNRREFNQLCESKFGFLAGLGFTKRNLGAESAYVTYENGTIAVELKWEDFGYYITACIIREELEQDLGWVSVNSLIKVTSPGIYRSDARGPAELFGHAALVEYYAEGLGRGLKMLLQDTEPIWQQCRHVDKQEAEREVFLADDADSENTAN